MSSPNSLTREAEALRLDAIACVLDIEVLQVQLHERLKARDILGAAGYNIAVAEKRDKAHEYLKKMGTV